MSFEPRPMCARCRRPSSVCYCAHVTPLATRTRVIILQHPRERLVPIGTARMASLCLPDAELHVGIDWSASPALAVALADPARPAVLLYPPERDDVVAHDVLRAPPAGPVTLVVVDGTWSQTRKVVRANPVLAALPRFAFTPPAPSEYRIRTEPDAAYVSTIEALAHVLGALEGEPERFARMLVPFRAMVDAQVAFAAIPGRGRSHGPRGPRPPKKSAPHAIDLRARRDDLVCVVGEVNAWPYRGGRELPDELVHWVAQRVADGATFEHVIAPRNALSEATPRHVGLSPAELAAGTSVAAFRDAWRAFVRDGDVVCAWGDFALAQLAAVDGAIPARLDVRRLARAAGRTGALDDLPAARAVAVSPGRGRAGSRVAALVAIANELAMGAQNTPGPGGR